MLVGLSVGSGGAALSYMVAMVGRGGGLAAVAQVCPGRVLLCRWCRASMPRAGTGAAPQFHPAQFHPAQFQAQRFQRWPFHGGRFYLDIVAKRQGGPCGLSCLFLLYGSVGAGLVVAIGGGRGESVPLHALFRCCQNILCYTFPRIGGGSVQIFFYLFWYSDGFCRKF